MNLSKLLINTAEVIRPVLTKLLPKKLLSDIKARVVAKASAGVSESDYEAYDPSAFMPGVNLIGNIRGDNGLGEMCRIHAKTLETGKIPYTIKNFFVPPGGSKTNHTMDEKITDTTPYQVNVISVNASEFVLANMQMGNDIWNKHYNIGYWAWEMEEFPEEWMPAFELCQEVWSISDFETQALRKFTHKPVMTVPLCIEAPTSEEYDRAYFGLPEDEFLFLVVFASGSVMERKNPVAAIKAFVQAFTGADAPKIQGKKPGLVIKINEMSFSEEDSAILTELTKDVEHVHIIPKNVSKLEINSLIRDVDVYVSLHRAEGFGLVLAEAMYVGTPTIATKYSGNLEFQNDEVACLVGYDRIPLEQDMPPFKKGYLWADAHVDEAAAYMRKLYVESDYYASIRDRAYSHVRNHLSYERCAGLVKARLEQIMNTP
ncbi:MAG: glycosyltransferase [Lachnospiraceae bacterium]|nr:glycosyltransferase [Lachnospiraceae bacterium]